MTEREILIANNRDQSKYRVITGAETLGELMDAINSNENVYKMVGNTWVNNPTRIDISGLTFTEGITKTQLLSRESALPTNVQFKGQTTNNLVMLLTNTNKQIRSGAGDRKEAYRLVKELGLADTIKENEGDNFTRCKTDVLWSYIDTARGSSETNDSKDAIAEVREELKSIGKESKGSETEQEDKKEKKLTDVKSAPHADTVEWFYNGIKSMAKDHLLDNKDIFVLADLLTDLARRLEEEKPKITASDMDDMMRSIRR